MEEPPESPLLNRIRNMWEFVAIVQFLYLFYDMFNLDDFDVEVHNILVIKNIKY